MTLSDWFGPISLSDLYSQPLGLSDRKLHLITAAFLRRVWDDLPSDLTRIAVAATEKHADGRMNAHELARLRSADLLDTCEALWTDPGYVDEDLIGLGCPCCEWGPRTAEYECRVAQTGYVLDGVEAAVRNPAACRVRAARYARELVAWKATRANRSEAEYEEASAQFDLFREITGPDWTAPHWLQWRTSDVLALARGIHHDQAYDRMPILADALQDAGCDDGTVLAHCREGKGHVRGCWVVDLAMGVS
jgi:hypothetical protein